MANPSPAALARRRQRAAKKAEAAKVHLGRQHGIAPPGVEWIGPPDPGAAIRWIEETLKVPTGPLTGQPFRLPDWQREWVSAALEPDTREAGLSISRKNGKSGLIAAVLLAALCGPLNRTGWRGVVASLTGNLAKELRDAIWLTAQASGLEEHVRVQKAPPPGILWGVRGSRIDFLAADKASGHALGADIAIIDEAGLLPEAKRMLWNALFTAISGRDGRFWCISIQGDGPMFHEMEQRAASGAPGLHWQKWAAPDECALDDEAAWHAANPALEGGIKSLTYMRDAARKAIDAPGDEMFFRAYDLNQPVDPERKTIVGLSEYRACVTPDAPAIEGDIVLGVDLGGSVSMTAAVAWCPLTGAIKCYGAFGDEPPLSVRARTDRMGSLYDRMVREGELRLYPGRVTPVVPFLTDVLADLSGRGRIVAVGADRHRRAEAQMAFADAGVPSTRCYWRGQGASATAHGSHDVRAFQKAVASKQLRTAGSTMLEAAIASSVLRFDGAGNPALDKAANNARIDALSAAVIACGIGALQAPAPLFGGLHIV